MQRRRAGIRLATYRYVENIVRDFNDYPKLIAQREEEVMTPHRPIDENIGGGRASLSPNQVERVVSDLLEDKRLNTLKDEYNAVNSVYERLIDEHKEVVRLLYMTRPRAKTLDGIAIECDYSRRQVIRVKHRFINDVAEKLGLS